MRHDFLATEKKIQVLSNEAMPKPFHVVGKSGLFYEQPQAMARSPQVKMARWPKADK